MMSNGWTVEKTSPYRASKFENLSYGLAVVTMDKDGVLKVVCCRHCGNLNSTCAKDVVNFHARSPTICIV